MFSEGSAPCSTSEPRLAVSLPLHVGDTPSGPEVTGTPNYGVLSYYEESWHAMLLRNNVRGPGLRPCRVSAARWSKVVTRNVP